MYVVCYLELAALFCQCYSLPFFQHHGNAANQHLPFMGNSSSSHFGDVNAPEMQQLVAVPNICVHCGDYFNSLTSPINPSVGAICQKCQVQRLTNGTGDTECDMDTKYEPELSETDNPHYYDANKLLFDAHVCRVQRKFNDA